MSSGLSGVALFTRILGMTPDEVELFLREVGRDIADTRIHAYLQM